MNLTIESPDMREVFIKTEPYGEIISAEQVKIEDDTKDPLSEYEAQSFSESRGGTVCEDPLSFHEEPKKEEMIANSFLMCTAGEEEEPTRGRKRRKVAKTPPSMFRAQKRQTVKESPSASLPRLSLKPLSKLLAKNSSESEFCYVCIDNIVEGSSFKEHFDQVHRGFSPCFICGAPSSSFTSLLNHLNTHPLSCKECNESFTCRKDALLHHKWFHSPTAALRISNSVSSGHGNIKSEREEVKERASFPEVILGLPSAMVKQKPACQNPKFNHVCAICMKGFRTRQHLRRHEFTHREKPEICKQCCLSFESLTELKEHRIKVHAGNSSWICDVCGLAYAKYLSYRDHVKKIHFGEKKVYKCELCDKVLANSNIYKTHLRTHSGEKPFTCGTCGKSYYDKYSMVKHEKLHKTKFVYKCSLCDKSYNRSCLLSEHIKWSHATTVEAELNNFKCGVCHKELGNADCYWQHVYNHSSQDIGKMLLHE